jgi:serine/threonine-protein kinase HipA
MQYHKAIGDGSVFPGAIADTEPDGWGRQIIRRDYAKRREAAKKRGDAESWQALTPIDYLLAVDDFTRVGALRFQDENALFQRNPDSNERSTPPLIELRNLYAATRAVESNSETAADLAYLRGHGTSLGGLRPKCSVINEHGTLMIGKFPSINDQHAVTKAEVLALTLAKKAGIRAAEARLIDSDGIPVALIRRFDRRTDGERLFYISAATMLGAGTGDGTDHTYLEIIEAIRQHSADAAADIHELWRRIAFTILINNVDDHLQNHGFLHVGRGHWQLSPAFDINPFPERARTLKTWISEEAGPSASIEALIAIAPYCRISIVQARQLLSKVCAALETWRTVANDLTLTASEIEFLADAFEHSESQVAKRWINSPGW